MEQLCISKFCLLQILDRLHLNGNLKEIKCNAKKRLKKLHLKIPSAAYIC